MNLKGRFFICCGGGVMYLLLVVSLCSSVLCWCRKLKLLCLCGCVRFILIICLICFGCGFIIIIWLVR